MVHRGNVLGRVQASKLGDDSDLSVSSQDEVEFVKSRKNQERKSHDEGSGQDSDSEDVGSDLEQNQHDTGRSSEADAEEPFSKAQPDSKTILSSISFGALVSAQALLGSSRKRKRGNQQDEPSSPQASSMSRSPSPFHEAEERQAGKSKHHPPPGSRTSKHAPMEMSSKKAVSRRRNVISVPKIEPRDPRFSNLSGQLNANQIAQNYRFLGDYRAVEIRQLKETIQATRDVAIKARLKKQLAAMEDQERARKKVEDERTVVREHRRKEINAVKQGKNPYFLKKAEIKKQVLVKTFENLSEKKVEKVMERRRKKKAMKERKSMPRNRRGTGEGAVE